MSLRTRLALLAVGAALTTVAGFGSIAYLVFARQQDAQLRSLLRDDLGRVAALLDEPRLGATLVDPSTTASALQFVTAGGVVLQRFGPDLALPLSERAQVLRAGGRTYLTASVPWRAAGGTIRLAHDVTGALDARRSLARSLVLSGLAVALLATLAGLVGARRALEPLRRVAGRARQLDPSEPEDIPYQGPRDEVHELTRALNLSLGRIRSRKEEERAFLVEIAHELAGPLTRVSYHLDDVRRDHPDDVRLRAAADAARELLRTSQDLLVLARGELERPLEPVVCDLTAIARRVRDEYPGVSLHVEGPAWMTGDPERLAQALRNLVRNGVQAAGAADGVAMTVTEGSDEVAVEVQDHGPGMAPARLAKVLQATRANPLNDAGVRGAGVGLTIAQRIAAQHQGVLEADSELGAGSRFRLRFPSFAARVGGEDGVEEPTVRQR